MLSRSGARYLDCSWPVSPDRSPNPACPSPGTGLSTVPAASGVVGDPGAGDLAAAVALPGDRDGFQVEQLDPVRRDRLPPPLGSGEGPADVFPPPSVQRPEPPDHPPPGEVGQVAQGVLAHCVLEVSCGIAASFPSRNRCRPSPCARALPGSEYYGGSAPSRAVRPTAGPAQASALAARGRADRDGSRVHCDSLDEGGAQLYPCGIATATPQLFTVASRQTSTCPPGSSPFRNERNGCAPLPALIRQI